MKQFDFKNMDFSDVEPLNQITCIRCRNMMWADGNDCSVCSADKRRREATLLSSMEKMGLPKDYHKLRISDYWNDHDGHAAIIKASKKMVTGDLKALVLLGGDGVDQHGCGTGKTTAAAMIMYERFLAGKHGGLYVMSEYIVRTQLDIMNSKDGRNRQDAMDQYIENDFLVIDEIGAGKMSAYHQDVLNEVIANRLTYGRQTLLISNHGSEYIKKTLHARVISRLNQYALVVKCVWSDGREAVRNVML